MKKTSIIVTFLSLLLMTSGCATTQDQGSLSPEPTKPQTPVNHPTDIIPTESQDPINLTATSIGDNQVQFTWSTSENLDSSGGFVIVRSTNPDPTYPENYYFTQSHERRSRIWVDLPSGKQYFRICNLVAGNCDTYSENIEVEVQ